MSRGNTMTVVVQNFSKSDDCSGETLLAPCMCKGEEAAEKDDQTAAGVKLFKVVGSSSLFSSTIRTLA